MIHYGLTARTLLVHAGAEALRIPTLAEAAVHGISVTGAVVVLHIQTEVESAPHIQKGAVEGLLRTLVEAAVVVEEQTFPRLVPRRRMLSSLLQGLAGSSNVIWLPYPLCSFH